MRPPSHGEERRSGSPSSGVLCQLLKCTRGESRLGVRKDVVLYCSCTRKPDFPCTVTVERNPVAVAGRFLTWRRQTARDATCVAALLEQCSGLTAATTMEGDPS
jgi:hypothetical protein